MNKLNKILHSATRKLGGEKKAKYIAILSIVAVIFVTLVSAAFIINTSDDSVAEDIGKLSYTLNGDGTATVTGLSAAGAAEKEIEITEKVTDSGGKEYSVTAIGGGAFANKTGITKVTIPDSVTSIGDNAFESTGLISVDLKNVTSIGARVFYKCSSLTSVDLKKVTSIGTSTFYDCLNLKSITIPDSVTSIGTSAFQGCSSLTSITIPDSVTSIGMGAFQGCSSLKEVIVGKNVKYIGMVAFLNCAALESVTIPNSASINANVFSGCSILVNVIITTGTAPTSDDVIAKYFSTPNWGLPGRETGITTLKLDFSNDYKYDLTNITTISTNERTIIFGDNANATVNGYFITKSGYDVNGADRAGFSFTSGGTGGAWETTAYKVTFNNSGGTGSMTDQFIGDKERALHPNIFTKDGYRFAGWSTTPGGSKVDYIDKQSITLTSNMPLYAVWIADDYKVTFNPSGGSGTMNDQTFTPGVAKNLSKNVFTKDGYRFAGWSVTERGSVVTYSDEALYTIGEGNVTLYAVWTPDDYKVTFDSNDGSGFMSDQTFTFGVAKNLSKNLFIRDGYKFAGWNTEANGSGISYADEASYTIGLGNATLYAQWTPDTHKVTFDPNLGTGTMGDQTFTFGVAKNLSKNLFIRDGYKFAGWNTEKDGSGTSYADEASYTIGLGNATLYAMWGHSVTPSSGKGGNISPDGNIIVTDGTDKTFTIKADKGFKIKDVMVDGVSVGAVSTYTFSNVTGNHTIYAEFERASPEPGPVNPTNPDSPNGLYLGFIAVFAVLLASLVAVLVKLRK